MAAEPYIIQLDPDTKATLKMYLYKNVQNVGIIWRKISSFEWACAVIKPSLILDPFQVAVAANRAAVAEKRRTMVTRTVFSEILFNLSLTKNISQSLSKFGIEKDKNLLVCFIVRDESDPSNEILPQIEGDLCLMSELADLTCMKDVKSVYKLHNIAATDDSLLDIVVSRMVTKDIVCH